MPANSQSETTSTPNLESSRSDRTCNYNGGWSSGTTGSSMLTLRDWHRALHDQPQWAQWVALYCERVAQLVPEDDFDLARQASGCLLEVLSQEPESEEVYELLAQIYGYFGGVYFKSECFDRAAQFYRQALEIQPMNPQFEGQLQNCVRQQQAFEERLKLSSPELPQGVYTSTRDWWRASGLDVQHYIEIMPGVGQEEDCIQKGDWQSPLPECGGIDCQQCLNRIASDLQLTEIAPGIRVYAQGEPVAVKQPETFVATVPGGRAWVMPQETWWRSCEAIAMMTPDHHLLADVSREYPGSLPGCDRRDPTQHRIFHQASLPPLEAISGTVAVLAGLSPNVYFHWMVDILPRWELLRRGGFDWDEIDWFYINQCPHSFGRETLKRLGVPESKILECDRHPYIQADRLVVPSFPGYLGGLPDWALAFLRQTFLPENVTGSGLPERIYISRAQARYRHVLNEAEVTAMLGEFGFVSIVLESLPLDEQIALFANAKVIVAPHGSGLTNLIFCQPQTQVIELVSGNYIRHYFSAIGQSLKLDYSSLEGKSFVGDTLRSLLYPKSLIEDLFVDIKGLKTMLNSLEKKSNQDGRISQNTGLLNYAITPDVKSRALQSCHQAEDHFERQQFDGAITACKEALALDPTCATACKILGNVMLSQRKLKAAAQWYRKALERQPDYAEVYANLGSLLAYHKNWQKSLSYYQAALKIKPDLTIAHENISKVWDKLGNELEAAKSLYRAYELNSDRIQSEQYLNLGNRFFKQNELTLAIACYHRSLEKKPDLFGAYQNLAEALTQQGKFEEANQYYRQAVKLGLTSSGAPIAASEPEFSSGELISQMLQANADVNQAYQNLNQAYQTLDVALTRQEKLQREALRHRHAIQSLYVSLQSVLGTTGDYLPTLNATPTREGDVLTRLFQPYEPSQESVLQQAQAQCDRGNFPEAIVLCEQAVLAQPDATAYEIWGTALAGMGKRAEAIQKYRAALALESDRLELYLKLGHLYSIQQQWQPAIEVYRVAMETHPQVAEVRESLGDLYVQCGELEEAIDCYQEAIDLEPQAGQVYQKLGDILQTQGKLHEAMAAYRHATQLVIGNV
jgi:tetratricopeptide (TPR) repeat protein/capsular polysaccharide biosynthesis protein